MMKSKTSYEKLTTILSLLGCLSCSSGSSSNNHLQLQLQPQLQPSIKRGAFGLSTEKIVQVVPVPTKPFLTTTTLLDDDTNISAFLGNYNLDVRGGGGVSGSSRGRRESSTSISKLKKKKKKKRKKHEPSKSKQKAKATEKRRLKVKTKKKKKKKKKILISKSRKQKENTMKKLQNQHQHQHQVVNVVQNKIKKKRKKKNGKRMGRKEKAKAMMTTNTSTSTNLSQKSMRNTKNRDNDMGNIFQTRSEAKVTTQGPTSIGISSRPNTYPSSSNEVTEQKQMKQTQKKMKIKKKRKKKKKQQMKMTPTPIKGKKKKKKTKKRARGKKRGISIVKEVEVGAKKNDNDPKRTNASQDGVQAKVEAKIKAKIVDTAGVEGEVVTKMERTKKTPMTNKRKKKRKKKKNTSKSATSAKVSKVSNESSTLTKSVALSHTKKVDYDGPKVSNKLAKEMTLSHTKKVEHSQFSTDDGDDDATIATKTKKVKKKKKKKKSSSTGNSNNGKKLKKLEDKAIENEKKKKKRKKKSRQTIKPSAHLKNQTDEGMSKSQKILMKEKEIVAEQEALADDVTVSPSSSSNIDSSDNGVSVETQNVDVIVLSEEDSDNLVLENAAQVILPELESIDESETIDNDNDSNEGRDALVELPLHSIPKEVEEEEEINEAEGETIDLPVLSTQKNSEDLSRSDINEEHALDNAPKGLDNREEKEGYGKFVDVDVEDDTQKLDRSPNSNIDAIGIHEVDATKEKPCNETFTHIEEEGINNTGESKSDSKDLSEAEEEIIDVSLESESDSKELKTARNFMMTGDVLDEAEMKPQVIREKEASLNVESQEEVAKSELDRDMQKAQLEPPVKTLMHPVIQDIQLETIHNDDGEDMNTVLELADSQIEQNVSSDVEDIVGDLELKKDEEESTGDDMKDEAGEDISVELEFEKHEVQSYVGYEREESNGIDGKSQKMPQHDEIDEDVPEHEDILEAENGENDTISKIIEEHVQMEAETDVEHDSIEVDTSFNRLDNNAKNEEQNVDANDNEIRYGESTVEINSSGKHNNINVEKEAIDEIEKDVEGLELYEAEYDKVIKGNGDESQKIGANEDEKFEHFVEGSNEIHEVQDMTKLKLDEIEEVKSLVVKDVGEEDACNTVEITESSRNEYDNELLVLAQGTNDDEKGVLSEVDNNLGPQNEDRNDLLSESDIEEDKEGSDKSNNLSEFETGHDKKRTNEMSDSESDLHRGMSSDESTKSNLSLEDDRGPDDANDDENDDSDNEDTDDNDIDVVEEKDEESPGLGGNLQEEGRNEVKRSDVVVFDDPSNDESDDDDNNDNTSTEKIRSSNLHRLNAEVKDNLEKVKTESVEGSKAREHFSSTPAFGLRTKNNSIDATIRSRDTDITTSVVTWNLAESSPSEEEASFMKKFRHTEGRGSDFVLIGGQETENTKPRRTEGSRSRELRRLAIKMLGKKYIPLALHSLGGVQLLLSCKRSILHEIEYVSVADVACGVGNVFHNKGAIGAFIRMKARNDNGTMGIKSKSIKMLFVVSHLAAHVKHVDARNADYWRIASELEAQAPPQFLAGSNKGSGGEALMKSLDHIIFCGDLNYRIDLPREITERTLHEIESILESNNDEAWKRQQSAELRLSLLRHDQLLRTISEGQAFNGLAEGEISFPPTFKFDKGSRDYDTSYKQRIPAWTDRILFKPNDVQVIEYDCARGALHSDHRPVYASLILSLVGKERNTEMTVRASPSSRNDVSIKKKRVRRKKRNGARMKTTQQKQISTPSKTKKKKLKKKRKKKTRSE